MTNWPRTNWPLTPLLLLATAVLGGCGLGTIYLGGEDASSRDATLGVDAGTTADGRIPGSDAQSPAGDAQSPGVCQGVDCGFGACVDVGGAPSCDCTSGYHAEGLTCVEDPPPNPCDNVACGANAACVQGACVCNAGYEGDPVAGCSPVSTDEELARAELVSIAQAEIGNCEGVDDRPYMQYQPGYWCYDFVAWVYQQSSWSLPEPYYLPQYSTDSLPAGWRPEPGDLIKFNIQHFGMVAAVSPDGQSITTIEGNVNSCVMQRSTTDVSVEYYGTLDNVFAP